MPRRISTGLALLALVVSASANTYTVTKTADSGTGSLRWAITQANTHAGGDLVTFSSAMSGKTIKPLTAPHTNAPMNPFLAPALPCSRPRNADCGN